MTPRERSELERAEEESAQRQRQTRRAPLTEEQVRQRDELLARLERYTEELPSEFDHAIGVVQEHLGGTVIESTIVSEEES